MLWDRTVIMQNGQVKANVARQDLDESGETLTDLFFAVTEGLSPEDESLSETTAEDASAGAKAEDGAEKKARRGLFSR